MKRSEIYLRAAELCHDKKIVPWACTTFGYCYTVVGKFVPFDKFPELDHEETDQYEDIASYLSTDTDRDFILIFASELAKDTNN